MPWIVAVALVDYLEGQVEHPNETLSIDIGIEHSILNVCFWLIDLILLLE